MYTPAYRFWHQLKGRIYNQKNEYQPIYVSNLSESDHASLYRALQQQSITPGSSQAALWLVLADTLGDPRIALLGRQAIEGQKKLLVFKPVGTSLMLAAFGPATACWHCFEQRHRTLDGVATLLYNKFPSSVPIKEPLMHTGSSIALAYAWITYIVDAHLRQSEINKLTGSLLTLDLQSMTSATHKIVRLSNCPACSPQPETCTGDTAGFTLEAHKEMV